MLRFILHEIKIGIIQDEPLRAGRFEIDLDAGMRALSFAVQDDAVTELAMSHTLAKTYAEFRSGLRCSRFATRGPGTGGHRTANLNLRAYLLNEL